MLADGHQVEETREVQDVTDGEQRLRDVRRVPRVPVEAVCAEISAQSCILGASMRLPDNDSNGHA